MTTGYYHRASSVSLLQLSKDLGFNRNLYRLYHLDHAYIDLISDCIKLGVVSCTFARKIKVNVTKTVCFYWRKCIFCPLQLTTAATRRVQLLSRFNLRWTHFYEGISVTLKVFGAPHPSGGAEMSNVIMTNGQKNQTNTQTEISRFPFHKTVQG